MVERGNYHCINGGWARKMITQWPQIQRHFQGTQFLFYSYSSAKNTTFTNTLEFYWLLISQLNFVDYLFYYTKSFYWRNPFFNRLKVVIKQLNRWSKILNFMLFNFRQMSGAMIRISNCEDREGSSDRTITISGTGDAVALAQYLINTR